MKNYNLHLSAFVLIFFTVFLTSCEKMFNKPPEVEDQSFTIEENSPAGTIIGQVVAKDKSGQEITFQILSGNDDEIFEFDNNTGTISVKNDLLLDFETQESFELTIQATDEFDKCSNCVVTINLTDVSPTTDHLLSYYKFNGNADDETGFSNATVTNGSYVTDDGFAGNKVLSLNGNGYANLNKEFDYSSRTVSLWFNTPSVSIYQSVVFTNDYQNYQYGFTSMMLQNIDGLDNFLFNISGNPVLTPISENKWYNVVAVLDNNIYSYYINGNLVSSGYNQSYVNSTLGYKNPIVGASRNFDRFFSGKIAEVRLYTKALSAQEVKTIFLETGK